MNLLVTANQRQQLDNFILLTGHPRSGTTVLGKILGSFQGLEYQFEPLPARMIFALVSSGQLDEETAELLLRVYLYEDVMLELIQGRRINLRPHDDSSIFQSKSWASICDRWQEIGNRSQAAAALEERGTRLAIKLPNAMDALDFILTRFPACQVILTARDGRQVVRSMLRKGWFSDVSLKEEMWPHQATESGTIPVPYWVEPAKLDIWPEMSAASRACYMWSRFSEWGLKALKRWKTRIHVIRYEELLADPKQRIHDLTLFLGLSATELTQLQVGRVVSPQSLQPVSGWNDFFEQVEPGLLESFQRSNQEWGYVGD